MGKSVTVAQLIRAIRALPSDEPKITPGKWYKTQKEHWLGWLSEYHGPGAYSRKNKEKRDAKFAYNHIVEVKMLLWLIEAARVAPALVNSAKLAATKEASLPSKSAAVRSYVPWKMVASALWDKDARTKRDNRKDKATASSSS